MGESDGKTVTETLEERVEAMLCVEPDPTREYYAITLLGTASGVEWSCISHWVGFTDDIPRREIRAASLIDAKNVAQAWRELGRPYLVVNSQDDVIVFMVVAGSALLERTVAEEAIPEFLAAHTVAQIGALGFTHLESLPKGALNRVPTATHRMRILKRDDFRCRICGRRAMDYLDVELHVHHIRPWAEGGVTEDSNLITLCQTCHKGLKPHFEWTLFDMVSPNGAAFNLRYEKGVDEYRRHVLQEVSRAPGAVGG